MNSTLSTRQLRLVGLLVGVVVLAAGYLVVTKHKTNTPSTASSTPAVTTPTHTAPSPSKAHTHATTPVKLVTHGLPVKIALALRKHSVVVVSLAQPGAASPDDGNAGLQLLLVLRDAEIDHSATLHASRGCDPAGADP